MKKVVLLLALGLSACATTKDPVHINVPVPVMPDAPEILTMVPVLPTPRFIHPGSDDAAVCLDRDGINRLKDIVAELAARESAWRHWYEQYKAANPEIVTELPPANGFAGDQ